jgi:uncharacterized protein (DUF1778 family)
MPPTSTNERLSIRLDRQQKEAIEKAASIQGLSLTDFVTLVSYREAQDVLRNQDVLVLSDRDRDLFLQALDQSPPPNKHLVKAAKRYRQAIESGALRVANH